MPKNSNIKVVVDAITKMQEEHPDKRIVTMVKDGELIMYPYEQPQAIRFGELTHTVYYNGELLQKLFSELEAFKRVESEPEDFHYRGMVMVRNKDVGKQKSRILKRYTFNSWEDYLKYYEEIDTFLKRENARFYINPTIKSYKAIAFDLLEALPQRLRSGRDLHSVRSLYDSVADSNTGIKTKVWIIDIDNPEITVDEIDKIKASLFDANYVDYGLTPNGVHFLVVAQHIEHLKKKIESAYEGPYEIKKNSHTLIAHTILMGEKEHD